MFHPSPPLSFALDLIWSSKRQTMLVPARGDNWSLTIHSQSLFLCCWFCVVIPCQSTLYVTYALLGMVREDDAAEIKLRRPTNMIDW